MHGQEVTYYSNIFSLVLMTTAMSFSGDLFGATLYAMSSHRACAYMVLYTLLAYVAISLHMVGR